MVPRPLSHAELLDLSELAGDAEVIATKGDVVILHFTSLIKGRIRGKGLLARLGLSKTIEFVQAGESRGAGGEPLVGSWSEDFRRGDRVRIYLQWRDGAYRTPAWNAAERRSKKDVG